MSTVPVSTMETVEACCSVICNANTGKAELFFFIADPPEEQVMLHMLASDTNLAAPPSSHPFSHTILLDAEQCLSAALTLEDY